MLTESAMGFVTRIFNEIVTSPLNLALLGAIGYVVYRIFSTQYEDRKVKTVEPPLPKVNCDLKKLTCRLTVIIKKFVNCPFQLRKQDMTMEQLKQYNGLGPDGRVLVAVNGKVFDVTRGKSLFLFLSKIIITIYIIVFNILKYTFDNSKYPFL